MFCLKYCSKKNKSSIVWEWICFFMKLKSFKIEGHVCNLYGIYISDLSPSSAYRAPPDTINVTPLLGSRDISWILENQGTVVLIRRKENVNPDSEFLVSCKRSSSRVERGQNAMNVIESDLLYTAHSTAQLTPAPAPGSVTQAPAPALSGSRQPRLRDTESVAGAMIIIITVLRSTQLSHAKLDRFYSMQSLI